MSYHGLAPFDSTLFNHIQRRRLLKRTFFLEDFKGNSSKFIRHTFRSTNTDCISLGGSPKRFQPRSSIQSSHVVCGWSTGFFLFILARKFCLGRHSEAFCLHGLNHLSFFVPDVTYFASVDHTDTELEK